MADNEKDIIEEELENEPVEETTEETAQEQEPEKTEFEKAEEQIAALSDKLMRTAAEFDNYKKRTAREKEDFYKMAVCETVLPFLAVLDNLERAVCAAEESSEEGSVLDGVKMIHKQFSETLSNIGVSVIEAVGCEFNPEMHNAVMTAESDEDENIILEEFQKGYMYKDKVIRHSMVKVSN